MRKIIFPALVLILIFASCEKKLDINLPDSEKHIVLNGIINPDSLIKVRISKSQNVLDNSDIEYLSEADVKLFKDGEFLENLTSTGSGYFISSINPEINAVYKLTVDYSVLNSVSTQNVLRNPVSIISVDTSKHITINDYGDGYTDTAITMDFKIKLHDNANTSEFLFLSLTSMKPVYDYNGDIPYLTGYEEVSEYFDSNDPVFRDGNNDFTIEKSSGKIFKDELFNGNDYEIEVNIQHYFSMYQPEHFDSSMFYIKLYTVSEDFYKYVKSYNLNQQSEYDPFAQPVQVFTNIENGLGLFTGYTIDTDSLIIEF